MICDGSCEKHVGEVKPVYVLDYDCPDSKPPWKFNYCDEAIAEDKRRGFTVLVKEEGSNDSNMHTR